LSVARDVFGCAPERMCLIVDPDEEDDELDDDEAVW
jgi:hypothetical protein